MVWFGPLLLTLQLMAVAVSIAAVIGVLGAWAASSLESGGRLGKLISRLFVAAMVAAVVTPMILHAAAWEATAGKFGWMIMTQTGARADASDAYGFFGGLIACGWIHGVVGAAIVALSTWYATRQTPAVIADQSRLEVGPIAAWWRVRLPIAAPWLVTAILFVAMLAATEMTVVDLYGYRSIADEFYLFYAADPSISSIIVTCVLPLAFAVVILSGLLVARRRLIGARYDSLHGELPSDRLSVGWQWFAGSLALLVAGVVLIVPMSGLVMKLGHVVTVENDLVKAAWSLSASAERLWEAPRVFAEEYRWTAIIALVAGLSAAGIAWPLAAGSRTSPAVRRLLDPATIVMVTLPGPIVGLAVVTLFQVGLPGFRLLYVQTIVPTVLALLVRAVPVAYWILRAAYRQVDTSIFESARLDGSWWRRFWTIDRPLIGSSLLAATLAAAVVASGDVPATLPVAPPGVSTVGTRLFGLLHSGARYQEAALATWYVGAITVVTMLLIRHVASSRVRV